MEEIELTKEFRFDAAHFLPNVPEGHKCRRMHGHSFRFKLHLKGKVDEKTGWLMDFAEVSKVVKPLLENYLDHYLLNEIEGLENPTSENISIWLWKKLKPQLSLLHKITLNETCTSACVYNGPSEK
ncbi:MULTISPECIES: 6-carboxytetrahydropterin synthase QueD [Leptospira]|uniref:6-carboxy-5,6,7,8-tetrahydropterin synthase n=2 Tax=Leptospira TaxID=171 RepID=A0A4R9GAN2_9LEPT|nr:MULTISPECIES: 6-carboxytetrahydropterin synthase QueD [Leptospira]TGK08405.1 6-carboxytetrahydropterin synthase QueD [Leptospira selangorensis]TGM15701.1 6-carboxytetrahydropterin synthase QueD [Leptospira selangorensis]TGM18349.1 6-carboxytetrahydropterin synthase QueD [Leptospira selangorensis]TGN02760.1 6-carboxytetrahydropterin synthase QueD [Leptospira dzoumogneensis]